MEKDYNEISAEKYKFVEEYFYNETTGLEIDELEYRETRTSYFDSIDCFFITTKQEIDFYVFVGNDTLTNLYPVIKGELLEDCYYKHVGYIAEISSDVVGSNFIAEFIKSSTIFPVLNRTMKQIEGEIALDKNSSQLSGIANQIRNCYITLGRFLLTKARSNNPNYKKDDFKSNLEEFLVMVLPGEVSKTRRNTINSIAQKGWTFNSELVHKDSITVFDIMISYNIMQLVVSTISNVIVGNNMPFNKIKCPKCLGENHSMVLDEDKNYSYICEDCGYKFYVSIDQLIKKLD